VADELLACLDHVSPLTVVPSIVLDLALESPASAPRGRAAARAAILACTNPERLGFSASSPLLGNDEVLINAPLAETLGIAVGDPLVLRLPGRSAVPADSPLGRRSAESTSRRVRVRGILPRGGLGDFSLRPTQITGGLVVASLTLGQAMLGHDDAATTLLCVSPGPTPSGNGIADRVRGCMRPTLADVGLDIETVATHAQNAGQALRLTSRRLLLDPEADRAAAVILAPLGGRPSLVFLANAICPLGRQGSIPYSTVVGIDSTSHPAGSLVDDEGRPVPLPGPGEIVVDRWMADDLAAQGSPIAVGDTVELTSFLPETLHGRVEEATSRLTISGIAAMQGAAVARDLVPEVDGITDEASIADWDPPFPFDRTRVRTTPPDDQDDRYWKDHGATPKAFVSLEMARSIAASRFGATTAWHLPVGAVDDLEALRGSLASEIKPESTGFRILPVASQALEAARGSTPFGSLFLGLSLVVVAAGLLLEWLLFHVLVAAHRRETGMLAALGWPVRRLAALILMVGGIAVVAGAVVGLVVAPLWSRMLIAWLVRSWEAAVAVGSRQVFGAAVPRLAAMWPGALAAAGVSLASLWWAACRAARTLPLSLLRDESPSRWRGSPGARGTVRSLAQLARRGLAHYRSRTVAVIAIVALAEFLVVVVSAFALRLPERPTDRFSPTGGWTHLASFAEPNGIDPTDPETAATLGLSDKDRAVLEACTIERIRVNGGDEASCTNLYATARPAIYGLGPSFIARGGFRFLAHAPLAAGEENAWTLLEREPAAAEPIPAILDEATARWALKVGGVGSRFRLPVTGDAPSHELEVVGLLEPGILQGVVIVSERNFLRMEPRRSGYSLALVDATAVDPSTRSDVGRAVASAWADVGVSVQTSVDRLRSLYAVQNTFLSGFQMLGTFGLLLGTLGVAAVQLQGVFERIGALAVLRAIGFPLRRVRGLIVLETLFMVGAGILGGALAGCLALMPLAITAGAVVPWGRLTVSGLLTLAAAVAAGLLATRGGTIPVRPRCE
ncbi:MAG: FtsX-like permease family protein, partial [Planctomycetia bacterium]